MPFVLKYITMKRYFLATCTLIFANLLFSQSNEEYELLNQVIPDLLNIKTNDTLNINEDQAEFKDQGIFFSEGFLISYTYPTLGVDSKKVKKIIRSLDFNYLSKQKYNMAKWDFKKINFMIDSSPKKNMVQKQYQISRVIFTKEREMAFIYYNDKVFINDYIDSSSTTVKIYKKKKGRWVFYLQIPIWIS